MDAAYQLDGLALLEESQTLGLEGVVAKKLDSPYRSGARNGEWLKVKVPRTQSFVIAGWMPSDVRPDRIGSLVLAVNDVNAKEAAKISRGPRLEYAGRVGTGFSHPTIGTTASTDSSYLSHSIAAWTSHI